jgi:hypothetical protein
MTIRAPFSKKLRQFVPGHMQWVIFWLGTQCRMRPYQYRDSGIQHNAQSKSRATETDLCVGNRQVKTHHDFQDDPSTVISMRWAAKQQASTTS